MQTKSLLLLGIVCLFCKGVLAQSNQCTFKPPFIRLDFGAGAVPDLNTASLAYYNRVSSACPSDGHYAFVSSTSDCFRGDWLTLAEDHTPGDREGNMLLVNSAYNSGVFFTTKVRGFKAATIYQIGVWLMNVCKPSDKCPFPLLPNLLIRLQTPSGKTVAQFSTGELPRRAAPHWTQYRAQFTLPAAEPELILTFFNSAPGGCGNDFTMDDITFQECVKPEPAAVVQAKKMPQVTTKKIVAVKTPTAKKEVEKPNALPKEVKQSQPVVTVVKSQTSHPAFKNTPPASLPVAAVPAVLKSRTNPLVRRIETAAEEVQIDLYDNGEIDGDTISVYHNNRLIVDRQRISKTPVSFRLKLDKIQPYHELVMVANNLGSIPPNTSLMIVTAGGKRYQVFISSTEQQNAKVVFALKEE